MATKYRNETTPPNRRSRLITNGVARSPNRAMLRAVGFADGDFDKPIVGVANGHSTMNPCNAGIQPLVDRAVVAFEAAGAKPQVFGVPTVTDGIGMGTEAMKYSLVSREVIADAIETAVNGQLMDGVLVIGGCDKNKPGGMIALARMNVPSIYVYTGTIKPGTWKGQDLTVVSSFEAVGAYSAGRMSEEDLVGIEMNACPTVGACGGMFTANTMACSFEALGMSLLGSSLMTAVGPEKVELTEESARVLVDAIRDNLTPSRIITESLSRMPSPWSWPRAAPLTQFCTTSPSPQPPACHGQSMISNASGARCPCCAISSPRDGMLRWTFNAQAECRRSSRCCSSMASSMATALPSGARPSASCSMTCPRSRLPARR